VMADRWKAIEPFSDPFERWICDATTPNATLDEWLKIEPTAPPKFYDLDAESCITYSCYNSGRESRIVAAVDSFLGTRTNIGPSR